MKQYILDYGSCAKAMESRGRNVPGSSRTSYGSVLEWSRDLVERVAETFGTHRANILEMLGNFPGPYLEIAGKALDEKFSAFHWHSTVILRLARWHCSPNTPDVICQIMFCRDAFSPTCLVKW